VLDEAQIVAAQPIALTDILLRTPGISMSRNGGYGATTSLRIRGADAGQTVMVIDGMRLSDASSTAGGYAFANFLIDDAERIEILRGPQSILWGSDAIGGVVNVRTRRPSKPLEGSFAVEAGSRDTASARPRGSPRTAFRRARTGPRMTDIAAAPPVAPSPSAWRRDSRWTCAATGPTRGTTSTAPQATRWLMAGPRSGRAMPG